MRHMSDESKPNVGNPLWLLAELTYRCPLHCVYCSNPVEYTRYQSELSTDSWLKVLREGRELGFVQLGFSGGEPLVRDDLEVLVRGARSHSAQLAGLDSGAQRFPEPHAHLRSQAQDRAPHQAAWLPDGAQRRAASPQSRPYRADPLDGRAAWRRVHRTCQYSVLWMGLSQSRTSAAFARTARACRGGDAPFSRARGLKHQGLFRRIGLLRKTAEAVHERMGFGLHGGHAGRGSAAMP